MAGLLAVALFVGCSEDVPSEPQATESNLLLAHYQSEASFEAGVIELDGERIDREWGSEFTPERGFTHVRVTAENGAGDPGTTRYVSMKAVYTDEHIYLLAQWMDQQADQVKDAFVYSGPDLTEPMIRCVQVGDRVVCDSLFRRGPEDSLLTRNWWSRFGNDDKFAILFEIDAAAGERGSFGDLGCLAACHAAGTAFGPMASGRLDLWYWMAGRTNPLRYIFDPYDPDKDEPIQGIPGYLDDLYVDFLAGIVPDEGTPAYWPNTDAGTGTPRHVYRRQDDPFFEPPDPSSCFNDWGGECRTNNGVSMAYLWREKYDSFYAAFSARDTLNQAVMPDPRKWQFGDVVPGYILTYPSGSRADVRGKATHDSDAGIWTLEMARLLDPGRALNDDVVFDTESGRRFAFTIAVFDAATHEHWGSETMMLVFGPKNGR